MCDICKEYYKTALLGSGEDYIYDTADSSFYAKQICESHKRLADRSWEYYKAQLSFQELPRWKRWLLKVLNIKAIVPDNTKWHHDLTVIDIANPCHVKDLCESWLSYHKSKEEHIQCICKTCLNARYLLYKYKC